MGILELESVHEELDMSIAVVSVYSLIKNTDLIEWKCFTK